MSIHARLSAAALSLLASTACGVDQPDELSAHSSDLDLGGVTLCPPTDGRIDDLVLSAPSGLLTRQAIHYVAGGSLDITVTVPKCTGVLRILRDGVELPYYDASLPDQPPASWELVSTTALDSSRQLQTVRLHVDNDGVGKTSTIRVAVGSSWSGTTQAARDFTLALVNRVSAQANHLATSIDASSFTNVFIKGIFEKFGDAGEFDADGKHLYNPSYQPSISFQADGVHLSWSVTAQAPWYACDQRITFSGVFRLEPALSGATVVWDGDHPTATFAVAHPWPTCWSPLGPTADQIADAEQTFQEIFQGVVDDELPDVPLALVLDIEHVANEIRLVFDEIAPPRVFIKVPYLSYNNDRHASPYANGMAIVKNEDLMLFTQGTASVCSYAPAVYQNQCWSTRIGPGGVPNLSTNPPFVDALHPAPLAGERAEAAEGFVEFMRAAALPMPSDNVGRMTARVSNMFGAGTYRGVGESLGAPCKMRVEVAGKGLAWQHRLTLATNDVFSGFLWNNTASQSYEVGIAFLGEPDFIEQQLLDAMPTCD